MEHLKRISDCEEVPLGNNGAAIFDTGEVEPAFGGNAAIEAVFRNPLIWNTFGSYLNVGDLKVCRLVNSQFHAMVMKETNFLERCLVSLKPNQITGSVFRKTCEPWKNVLLKFGDTGEDSSSDFFAEGRLEWLDPIIANLETLSLRMEKGTKGNNFYPVLKRILNAKKKLRALAMEPIFLVGGTRDIFNKCEDTLANLEEFEVLQPPSEWLSDLEEGSPTLPPVHRVASSLFIMKMSELRVLKGYYPVQPVLVNSEEWFTLAPPEHAHFMGAFTLLSVLLGEISTRNRNTLKQVTLAETGFWQMEGPDEFKKACFGRFSFPSLESATFHMLNFQPRTVREYLATLPILKELDFSAQTTLPITVFNVIKERSDCLRKLKIESPAFKDMNWQFLKKIKIEEFQLELHYPDCADDETLPFEALTCLPSTIRRLFLRGPLQSNPISALARLNPRLVTQLTFINSGDCFTNDTMKYIRENFKMLRKLNVTNAKQLTDVAFVETSSESSLSEIKGLRTLILRQCGSITDASLREIRFLELRYLDLCQNKQLTQNGYEGLLSNNPSFETLLMSCTNFYGKKEHMLASHPRLSSIAYRRIKP